jgi:carbamoyltransferase
MSMPLWLRKKLHLRREMNKGLNWAYKKQYVFTEHHESHAASAFFPSPFEEAAILTLDGVGEWATASIALGRGNKIQLMHEQRFPHSLGLLYSAFTYFTGFTVNSGEYKLMGLAPYGEPKYVPQIMNLIDLKEDGSFRMDMSYFNYCQGLTMDVEEVRPALWRPATQARARDYSARDGHCRIDTARHRRTSCSGVARHAHKQTGMKNFVLAGGGRTELRGQWKDPARSVQFFRERLDSTGRRRSREAALGVRISFIWHQLFEYSRFFSICFRVEISRDEQKGSLLGPERTATDEIRFVPRFAARPATTTSADDDVAVRPGRAGDRQMARSSGWYAGPPGVRDLGRWESRSTHRRSAPTRTCRRFINLKVKFREGFRPFCSCTSSQRACAELI